MDHNVSQHAIVIGAIVLAAVVIYFIPIVRIVQRTGHSGWWVLLALIPFGNIIGLWILAFGRWPSLEKPG